ncbi:hypothetical protein NIES4071_101440 (plasmid) [Calothrix sp. NIES-4071]|nr:hypothetical protein NIES4071_101440 [Calothrix sp. NIES-4071]BAZ64525.1 hypothetical protein NIES4105_102580 [Calothrix sp. NIES-4105]
MNTLVPNQNNSHKDEAAGTNISEISQRIARIIQKRQQLAKKVAPVCQHLTTLLTEIKLLGQHRQTLKTTLDHFEARESLDKIDIPSLEAKISTEITQLELLQQRFSRSTLNIGVVGWSKQGKSEFLKSLSGLTNNELPALPGGPCTAVRSKIEHHDDETQAKVTFHSESSFLEKVIAPYYEKLSLGTPPQSLDEFANQPFPESPDGVTNQTMYDHLRDDYYLPLNNYRQLLESGEPREISIRKEEIPNYVMQRRDAKNRLITFKHLAVREVKIFCRFPNTEVNQLGLFDVPGMGDTRLGDEDLMLQTLGCEVDIVMFLRRPDALGYYWGKNDTDLYDTVSKALPDLSERAFLILNHQTEGNNLDACRSLRDNTGEMKFVTREIANCTSPDEANRILILILQYLDQHIQVLEQKYAIVRQNSLIALYHTIQSDLGKARYVMRPFTQENKLFNRLFQEFELNLTNGLRDLVVTLAQEQDTVDVDFEAVVSAALLACEQDAGIPSEQEILNHARSLDKKDSYKGTYCVLIPELRAHLSKNFLTLDAGLQQAANKLKQQVAQVLIEKTSLGNLTNARGVNFLEQITEMLAERGNQLELGFRTLSTFNISYGALVLRLIRQNLMSVLDSDEIVKNHELRETAAHTAKVIAEVATVIGVSEHTSINHELVGQVVQTADQLANAVLDSIFDFDAKTVRSHLQKLHQQAVNKCRETLERWLEAPSQIRYYMATEFVDRVLDANNMQAEWDGFLRDPEIRSKVWAEFEHIEHVKQVQQNWLDALQKVLNLNQRSQFEFLY